MSVIYGADNNKMVLLTILMTMCATTEHHCLLLNPVTGLVELHSNTKWATEFTTDYCSTISSDSIKFYYDKMNEFFSQRSMKFNRMCFILFYVFNICSIFYNSIALHHTSIPYKGDTGTRAYTIEQRDSAKGMQNSLLDWQVKVFSFQFILINNI